MLRIALGAPVLRRIRPRLEEGVRGYLREAERRRAARGSHQAERDQCLVREAVARRLQVAASEFARELEQLLPLLDEATCTVGGFQLPLLLALPFDTATAERVKAYVKTSRQSALAILEATKAWQSVLTERSKGTMGRPAHDRAELGTWVGLVLKGVGVRLTYGDDGAWARTASVVYEAAGLHVPANMARELSKKCKPRIEYLSGVTGERATEVRRHSG